MRTRIAAQAKGWGILALALLMLVAGLSLAPSSVYGATTISGLPEETAPASDEVMVIEDATTTKKATLANIAANMPAITAPSLTLSTTPLPVTSGGWGLATLTPYSLYTGNGTGLPQAVGVGTTGQILGGVTGDAPSWSSNPPVPFAAKTADYTLTASDKVLSVDATSSETTITLPTAAGIAGRCYTIKKIDSSANAVVLDGNGAETIDGSANYRIVLQWQAVTVISNGTNWLVI
uniref:Uncharacterized protein n=4 Tax=viral metagenome TaxID=1070528 RepID=A0A6M3XUH7_9ZZZZ